ncbi:MAG TPA: hypothetical protein VGK35_14830 [Actinotalea sp.]
MRHEDELKQIGTVRERLVGSHPDVDPSTVDDVVSQVQQVYAASRVRDFVPLLVERDARDRLDSGSGRRAGTSS